MSALPSIERMTPLATALGIPVDGATPKQLHKALGAKLVTLMLPSVADVTATSGAASNANGKRPMDGEAPKEKKKRTPSAWIKFMATERAVVKLGMPHLTSRGDIIREVARRWQLKKASGTTSAPLLLMYKEDESSDSDSVAAELTVTLMELPRDELHEGLKSAGMDIDEDDDVNAARLAASMLC